MSKGQLTPPNIHAITAKWRKFPLKNPYNDNEIILSVNPKSEYVVLYKKVINELISQIIIDNTTTDKSHKYQLTIKDCKFIKNALPDKHAIIEVSENNIKYDKI
jgi:predicted transcriptional regulator